MSMLRRAHSRFRFVFFVLFSWFLLIFRAQTHSGKHYYVLFCFWVSGDRKAGGKEEGGLYKYIQLVYRHGVNF